MQAKQRRSAAEWSELVTQWEASDVSTTAFAARHGVGASSLYWWRHKLAEIPSGAKQSASASSSVVLKGTGQPVAFTEIRVAGRAEFVSPLEVVARSGHVIRVHGKVDASALRALLAAVERC